MTRLIFTFVPAFLQTAYPLRIQQVHIVNMPSYAQSLVTMVLGVVQKKIANRVRWRRSRRSYRERRSYASERTITTVNNRVTYVYIYIYRLQIMIHNNVADLKKYLSPDVLPLDYGGTFPKTVDEITGESRNRSRYYSS